LRPPDRFPEIASDGGTVVCGARRRTGRLAAAYKLSQRGWRDVTVLERGSRVGGNAGSFVIDGIPWTRQPSAAPGDAA
jgi:protoporphyrinogen oxidase